MTATPYPAEPASWTPDNPPAGVRLCTSARVHAANVLAGRVLFPACGAGVGQPTPRTPVTDPAAVNCPACARIPAATVPGVTR